MKKSNILLGVCLGFVVLSVLAIWINISVQILTVLSLFSLLFTLAQIFQNFSLSRLTEQKKQLETFNTVCNSGLTPIQLEAFFKCLPNNESKRDKMIRKIGDGIEVFSYIILIGGIVIPIPFFDNEKIGTIFSLLSFSCLFLSLFLSDYCNKGIEKWNNIQKYIALMRENKDQNK